jgi:hypothetical protein
MAKVVSKTGRFDHVRIEPSLEPNARVPMEQFPGNSATHLGNL